MSKSQAATQEPDAAYGRVNQLLGSGRISDHNAERLWSAIARRLQAFETGSAEQVRKERAGMEQAASRELVSIHGSHRGVLLVEFLMGAAIEGLSMAAFVRLAARQRAAEAVQREQQLALSQRDFAAFQAAISQPFAPNPALQEALEQARTRVSRA